MGEGKVDPFVFTVVPIRISTHTYVLAIFIMRRKPTLEAYMYNYFYMSLLLRLFFFFKKRCKKNEIQIQFCKSFNMGRFTPVNLSMQEESD